MKNNKKLVFATLVLVIVSFVALPIEIKAKTIEITKDKIPKNAI